MIRVTCLPVEGLNGWGFHLREEIVMPRRIVTMQRHAIQIGTTRTICGRMAKDVPTTIITMDATCRACRKIMADREKEREKEERHGR